MRNCPESSKQKAQEVQGWEDEAIFQAQQTLGTYCQAVCPWHLRSLVVTPLRKAILIKSHPRGPPSGPEA